MELIIEYLILLMTKRNQNKRIFLYILAESATSRSGWKIR